MRGNCSAIMITHRCTSARVDDGHVKDHHVLKELFCLYCFNTPTKTVLLEHDDPRLLPPLLRTGLPVCVKGVYTLLIRINMIR